MGGGVQAQAADRMEAEAKALSDAELAERRAAFEEVLPAPSARASTSSRIGSVAVSRQAGRSCIAAVAPQNAGHSSSWKQLPGVWQKGMRLSASSGGVAICSI